MLCIAALFHANDALPGFEHAESRGREETDEAEVAGSRESPPPEIPIAPDASDATEFREGRRARDDGRVVIGDLDDRKKQREREGEGQWLEGAKKTREGWKIERASFAGDERHVSPSVSLSLSLSLSLYRSPEFRCEISHPRGKE